MADGHRGQGEFVYIGMENQLLKHVNPDLHVLEPDSYTKLVEIDTNIDGVKVFKSSSKDVWVVSCRVVDKFNLYKPFTVSTYYGRGKPGDTTAFLNKFICELNKLSGIGGPAHNHGFMIDNQHYRIRLRHFICDTPARSLLKNTKGHTGFFSCERCEIKGPKALARQYFCPAGNIQNAPENLFELSNSQNITTACLLYWALWMSSILWTNSCWILCTYYTKG